jgi:hypothetical protein
MRTTAFIISIVLPFFLVTQIHSQNVVQNPSVSQQSLRPLIATEQEVNQFLKTYIERYTNKDIDGFLWLFSLKAVQNHNDRLPGIREIYSNFFDQAKTLNCRIEDRKIEIYENVVEVRARYDIEQIVKKGGGKKVWRGRIRWVLIREEGILKIVSLDYKHERPS